MLSASYNGNSAVFSYDSRNRETSETWTIGGSHFTLSYSYDQVGNVVTTTYPDGTTVNISIDPMNRATTVKTGSTTFATIAYRPDSKISSIVYGNGVQSMYKYDVRARPSEIKVVQGQSTLLDLNYSYDNTGNVISIGTESYAYDYLNRLTTGTGGWGTIKYGYDGVGNRLWLYQSPTNTTYTYGSYDRLSSAGSSSYTYDNNGNRITQLAGGTTTRYSYDFENRLTSVSQGSSTLENYTYSPWGQRIQKIESGITTVYVNRDISVLYEKQGSTSNDYAYVQGFLIARLSGTNTYYFHQDALGSTRLVTLGSSTSFSTNYEPFGTQYGSTGTDPSYKYTGKPQDSSSGLYYYSARYFDNSVGTFSSRDPVNQQLVPCGQSKPQEQNVYSYVKNNPEILTDPTGLAYYFRCQCGWFGCKTGYSFNEYETQIIIKAVAVGALGTALICAILAASGVGIPAAAVCAVIAAAIALVAGIIDLLDSIGHNQGVYFAYSWWGGYISWTPPC